MGVWIDSDMGFDDLWAVLMVAAAAPVDGLSLCFGNALLPQVALNAAGAAAAFGWRFPIHAGADRGVMGARDTALAVHGPSGMPSAGARLPEAPAEFPPAFPALCAWVAATARPRILALGPLTNLAILWLARPDLAQRVGEIVWMGGGATSGNQTATTEFNAWADPEALAILLACGAPLAMVDLDACRQVTVATEDAMAVRAAGGRNAALLADLLAGYIGAASARGRASMAVYDPVAAAAFLRPELGTFRPARIDAALSEPLTRGRTVVDARPTAAPNARYLAALDAPAVRTACLDALLAAAR